MNNVWLRFRARWTRFNKGDNIKAHNENVGSLRLILYFVPFIVRSCNSNVGSVSHWLEILDLSKLLEVTFGRRRILNT